VSEDEGGGGDGSEKQAAKKKPAAKDKPAAKENPAPEEPQLTSGQENACR
jgi:hypothetical protein